MTSTMLEPMLASLAHAPLDDPQLVYEPKYDGIRAIAEVDAGGRVQLWSRLGNDKTSQFPEIAQALSQWARRQKVSAVLDGEVVALDANGDPSGFQNLQGRIHLKGQARDSGVNRPTTAYIAFDLLRESNADLRELPLVERRARLERLFAKTRSPLLRLSEQVRGDGRALYSRALARAGEGVIAKRANSRYKSGKRTPDWRKLKIVHEQEFVIGGWTEPRQTRAYFGALLLGVYEPSDDRQVKGPFDKLRAGARGRPVERSSAVGELVYVGHVGTGFNEKELGRLMNLLRPLEIEECPFRDRPASNERPHWVTPTLVAEVKFTEWTADGKLRHPVYVGLRDDKKADEVRREEKQRSGRRNGAAPRGRPRAGTSAGPDDAEQVVSQLSALEDAGRDGTIELPGGDRLAVTNLRKVFWPRQKITKGDLLRYYAQVAPFILSAVADRPLVMKRYPNGIAGKPFYQHRAPDVPPGVRVETIDSGAGSPDARRPQLVGGNLLTLLYMAQLASISQDPWFSRIQTPAFADHVALDLDPMPGLPFTRVLEVARWIRDELQTLGASGFAKTSGADGLHIYIPMPPDTPYEAGLLFCQIVATVVANKHPKHATIERTVRARGQRVYVDYLQNILGKTLASAYSARSSEFAGVSAPLTWQEVDEGVRREDFTLRSAPARFKRVGDLWAGLRKAKGVDLSRVARYTSRRS